MFKILNAGLVLWVLTNMVQAAPYPDALDNAAIEVERMDSILNHALIIGNGDINALVWNEGGATTLMLTKNDVWDARLLTYSDPPLPTLKRIKELGAKGGAVGVTRHGFIFPEGYTFNGTDSYHVKPYPCPILCGKLVLGKQDPSDPKATPGKLDISKAVVTTGTTVIRALANRNVFLVRTGQSLSWFPAIHWMFPQRSKGHGVMCDICTKPSLATWIGRAWSLPLLSLKRVTSRPWLL